MSCEIAGCLRCIGSSLSRKLAVKRRESLSRTHEVVLIGRVGDISRQRSGTVLRELVAGCRGLIVDLRKQRRAGAGNNSTGLLDVGCGDFYALVVRQSIPDQLIEHGVVELRPPIDIRGRGRLRGLVLESLGNDNGGAMVVWTHWAARE